MNLAAALAEVLAAKIPARQAALSIAARVPEGSAERLLAARAGRPGVSPAQGRRALSSSGISRGPRGAALAVQDALSCSEWRVAGSRLAGTRRGAGSAWRDAAAARWPDRAGAEPELRDRLDRTSKWPKQHAAISETRGQFAIRTAARAWSKLKTRQPHHASRWARRHHRDGEAASSSTCVTTGNADRKRAPRSGMKAHPSLWSLEPKREGARAGALSRHGLPASCSPPEQVRPALQTLPLQHRSVLAPQRCTGRGHRRRVAGGQVSSVRCRRSRPHPTAGTAWVADPPQAQRPPTQAPAWQTPVPLGQIGI